jgi:hypothetical protein
MSAALGDPLGDVAELVPAAGEMVGDCANETDATNAATRITIIEM